MPRPSKGARLYKRKARYRNGKLVGQAVWLIKDGDRHIATGCLAGSSETKPPREAEQALADYIARKYQPERRRRDIEDIDCADVLSIYLTDVGEPGEQFEIEARIERLNEFWGGKTLSEVNARTCAAYARHRGNAGGARRDLETLRAAINHHAKEGLHHGIVRISLPPKGEARDRWLTRSEAAALIWRCWKYREKQTIHAGDAKGSPVFTEKRPLRHVARFILIGIYTGHAGWSYCSCVALRRARPIVCRSRARHLLPQANRKARHQETADTCTDSAAPVGPYASMEDQKADGCMLCRVQWQAGGFGQDRVQECGQAGQAFRPGDTTHPAAHSRDLVDATGRADLGGRRVPRHVSRGPAGDLRAPSP